MKVWNEFEQFIRKIWLFKKRLNRTFLRIKKALNLVLYFEKKKISWFRITYLCVLRPCLNNLFNSQPFNFIISSIVHFRATVSFFWIFFSITFHSGTYSYKIFENELMLWNRWFIDNMIFQKNKLSYQFHYFWQFFSNNRKVFPTWISLRMIRKLAAMVGCVYTDRKIYQNT